MLVQVQPPSDILNGKVTVTTAGTRVKLGTATIVSVTITALTTNSGLIYVGNAGVSSANGLQLSAGNSISLDIASLGIVWIDSAVNGEGVTYLANVQ